MSRHRLYYAVKPFLPWRVRMALRRFTARRQRLENAGTWPVFETAARKPEGWPGWPDGKDFAFVITHDVEGPEGLAKCRALAELELSLGIRSSFNFIPEGPYAVPDELRHWLTGHGFEVGVHDLNHDGRLFSSQSEFQRKAVRINRYLSDWRAGGFRAGFMLRNLDWLHDLDIAYDLSTFDSDPFEPQSEGTGTIFPFWVMPPADRAPVDNSPGSLEPVSTADRRGGYVELPYTLPQDSTLYLVLRETSPAIWLNKLDWIAASGGMALVNVHPDYLSLDGERPSARTFPVKHYTDLLRHVRARYDGRYHNAVPGEIARSYAAMVSAGQVAADTNRLRGKQAAVLLYSGYPSDPRPRRAAETMIAAGMNVDLLCLAEEDDEPLRETVNGVRVFRVRMKRRRAGKMTYLWQYGRFIASSFWFLTRRSLMRQYDVVHVHNMPDVLVFAALVPKLRGARVILDQHDPMPELMTTIFGVGETSFAMAVLKRMEKWSLSFADRVLTVNEACRKIFSSRSCPLRKIHVIMNAPDETIFRYRPAPVAPPAGTADPARRFVVMYHGSLVERHGLDLAVAAVRSLRPSIPGIELRVYGQRTAFLDKVMQTVEKEALGGAVRYLGPRNLEGIVEAILECDVGVIPNRRSIFTEINTPTRIFEYLSQGRAVIAPRAPGIEDYFGPEDLFYFNLGDAEDLTRSLGHVFREPAAVAATVARGQRTYLNHAWTCERRRYLSVLELLLGGTTTPDPVPAAPALAVSRAGE